MSPVFDAWQQHVDLSALNSFHVPARARYFAVLEQEDELPTLLNEAADKDLPVLILGGGSNMLLTRDFPGLVIQIALKGISQRKSADSDQHIELTIAAGENWHNLVAYALAQGFYGLENLALIPGSVGAAPVQNIGAYGVELSDVLLSVRYFDREQQRVMELAAADCALGYRDSIFKQALKNKAVILSVTLRLAKTPELKLDYPALQQALKSKIDAGGEISAHDVFDAVCAVRRSKLPDPAVLGNAGSFFRNPLVSHAQYQHLLERWPNLPAYPTADPAFVKLPAAFLIEQAGWKGKRQGDAGIHAHQALVLVNHGNATGPQLLALAQAVASSVQQLTGVRLEPEVNVI